MRERDEGGYVGSLTGVLWPTGRHIKANSWLLRPEHAHLRAAYRYAATELGAASSILADVTPEVACLIWKIIQTGHAATADGVQRLEIR